MASFKIMLDDCSNALNVLQAEGTFVDSVVTDPPYELGYMGKSWDISGITFSVDLWRKVMAVLRPGGYLLAFGAPRSYHRLACAIEDAGLLIRDQLSWVHGNGYPKSRDLAKDLDRLDGNVRPVVGTHQVIGYAERNVEHGTQGRTTVTFAARSKEPIGDLAKQWQGWGTSLKPAHEPIVLAQRPLDAASIARNVAVHGVGGLNIAACLTEAGRWPANFLHDDSAEVHGIFATQGQSHAAQYFFSPRVSNAEREKYSHPTIKPLALMQYLTRLVTPPGGVCLDIFAGTGTTGEAALSQGFSSILIEKDTKYVGEIKQRLARYNEEALYSF